MNSTMIRASVAFKMTKRARRVAACALVASMSACSADASEEISVSGISRELADLRTRTISDVQYSYDIVVPEGASEAIEGRVGIAFDWADAESMPLVIDFESPEARVRSVRVGGADVAWQARNDHVVIAADALTPGERNTVEIEFVGGDEALNRNDDFLYTLFVPDRAHTSLPLFDQPNLKARVTLTLTVPAGWVAVANGPALADPGVVADLAGEGVESLGLVVEADAGATGARRYEFAETRPIPSYLIGFAAGRFKVEAAEREGRRYVMYHRETDAAKVAANRDEVFDLVSQSVAWLERYTEIEFPFQKYDFVLVPSFQYGGMEHPGAVLYRQESMLLDASATQAQRLGRASLIAHETAHMWFGDLVTMSWFDDVWMKEVFANFFAAKIAQPAFPDIDHALRFVLAHHPAAYSVDRTPGANAIRQELPNLNEAGTLYGPIIYQKAPIVMRQLEDRVGEATLRDGLRTWLRDNSYGNSTWTDLVSLLAQRVPGDLVAWSRAWVEEPGRPVIEVLNESDATGRTRVVVRQSDSWGRGRIWPQNLTLFTIGRGADAERTSRVSAKVSLDSARLASTPWDGRPTQRWLLPTGSGIEYGLVVLDDLALLNLLEDVTTIPAPLDRGTAWLVLRDALLDDRVAPRRVYDRVLAALQSETNEQLLGLQLGLLSEMYWRYTSDADRLAQAPVVEELVKRRLESAESVSERSLWFRAWRGLVMTESGVQQLRDLWAQDDSIVGLPFSEADFVSMAEALALRVPAEAEAILDEQRSRITNPDRLARFDFVRPALSGDLEQRRAFFASLADPANRAREPWVTAGLGFLHHPLRRAEALEFIAPALEMLPEIQRTGDIFFPSGWLNATLGEHNSEAAVQEVIAYLGRAGSARMTAERGELTPQLRGKLLQAADGVVRAARLLGEVPAPLPGARAR